MITTFAKRVLILKTLILILLFTLVKSNGEHDRETIEYLHNTLREDINRTIPFAYQEQALALIDQLELSPQEVALAANSLIQYFPISEVETESYLFFIYNGTNGYGHYQSQTDPTILYGSNNQLASYEDIYEYLLDNRYGLNSFVTVNIKTSHIYYYNFRSEGSDCTYRLSLGGEINGDSANVVEPIYNELLTAFDPSRLGALYLERQFGEGEWEFTGEPGQPAYEVNQNQLQELGDELLICLQELHRLTGQEQPISSEVSIR